MQNGLINGDAVAGRRRWAKEEEKTQTSNYISLRRVAILRVAVVVVVVLVGVCFLCFVFFLSSGSQFIGLCTLSLLVKMSRRDGNWWQAAVIFRQLNDVQGAREAAPVNS